VNPYLKDLLERVAATAAFTFLSVFELSDLSTAESASIAAGAAALSLVKGALAKFIGDESAGLK
jgi:hypothetical protein